MLADPGDWRGLAEQIERLRASPELRQRLVDRALEQVKTEFGRDLNLERLARHLGLAAQQA